MREHRSEIEATGAAVVAIGTGNAEYAAAFVSDEQFPFLVLVDDDAEAARAASVVTSSFVGLLHPRTWKASFETHRRGHRVHKAGARVTQLGATFVIGPGDTVHYEHVDRDSTDHAPLETVLGALRARR